jgi:hypothetical protein
MSTGADPLGLVAELAQAPHVDRALAAVRELLGMEVAYTTRHADGAQTMVAMDGDGGSFGVGAGTVLPLEQTYCAQVLDGRLPALMPDVAAEPVAAALPVTAAARVGAFCSVPLRLADGTLHGTLCAASHDARHGLGPRDEQFLHVLARIIADQAERDLLERARREEQLTSASVAALLAAVDARDGYTGAHSRAVVARAVATARELGLDAHGIADVRHVALLHDVGKIAVPDAILRKAGPLDDEEWAAVHEHPAAGARIIAALPGLDGLVPAVRAEHERWDGRGYPDGLMGEEIPLPARIVFVCDAYHAMTSDRPYRDALPEARAIAELRRGAGRQFCPLSVAALLTVLGR